MMSFVNDNGTIHCVENENVNEVDVDIDVNADDDWNRRVVDDTPFTQQQGTMTSNYNNNNNHKTSHRIPINRNVIVVSSSSLPITTINNSIANTTNTIEPINICIGYIFASKKMNTMSVVMAEASKVKLGLVVDIIDTCFTSDSNNYNSSSSNNSSSKSNNGIACADSSVVKNRFALTKARLMTHEDNNNNINHQHQPLLGNIGHPGGVGVSGGHIPTTKSLYGSTQSTSASTSTLSSNVSLSLPSDNNKITTTNRIHQQPIGISTTTTTTIPTISMNDVDNESSKTKTETIVPIRLSFVPLDFNTPLSEQHSGKIDIILHKITEDIVSASTQMIQLSSSSTSSTTFSPSPLLSLKKREQRQQQLVSMERIQRLLDYNQEQQQKQYHQQQQNQTSNHISTKCNNNHTQQMSYLIDHPMSVRKVMCRADIANTLHQCLHNIYTTSGIPVGTPKYAILKNETIFGSNDANNSNNNSLLLQEQIQHLSFPIIVKPLTAAGTKSSHAMTIIMDHHHQQQPTRNHGNDIVQLYDILRNKCPCLCQEYLNHDEVLYKVYVLGDYISVHQRRSLPNLPTPTSTINNTNVLSSSSHESRYTYINFDSQRPYPQLSDFGYTTSESTQIKNHNNNIDSMEEDGTVQNTTINEGVTVDEVRPIVDALREAFHLELFGFDILITTNPQNCSNTNSSNTLPVADEMNHTNSNKMMLVVDVNYFPSYKEVSNFPSLLAQYLAQRAISTSIR